MNLYVYSPAKEWLGEVRGISSLQWLELYSGAGELKLVCGASAWNLSLLKNGSLLRNTDRPHLLARVCSVEIDDRTSTASLTVRAQMTVCRLAERVVMYTEEYTEAEAGMLAIVQHNLRGLPLAMGPSKGLGVPLTGQVSWGSVLDAVQEIAAASALGFRVSADSALTETFGVYRGTDRSDPSCPDYVGFFGDAAKNLASVNIVDKASDMRNFAIVCGQGEGADRRVVEVDLTNGEERRELYVDARDLADTVSETGADGTVTERTLPQEEYDALLYARGLAKLAETSGGFTVKAELRQSMLLFGQDYELGDILPLRVARYDVSIRVRVTQVKIIYEKTKSVEAVLEVVP